jgi:hypothetical protein
MNALPSTKMPAWREPGRCQTMNERAGSVGVPRPSLSALQQRGCRQGLNLQEVYRVLTSTWMSLLSALSLLSWTAPEQRKYDSLRPSLALPIALFEVLFPRETGRETVMGARQARI